jgi:hypothetical protein
LTHALITIQDKRAIRLDFPPAPNWAEDQYREMHIACYSPEFMAMLETMPENVLHLSRAISLALDDGCDFQASIYHKKWYHFVESKDLDVTIDPDYKFP